MNGIQKFFGHIKTVCKHKYYVFLNCWKAGLIWRGIKHDLSKFTPTEFIESVKFYTGVRSPIVTCKKINGISYAWLHHKGRNKHHYEYWQDEFDYGGHPIRMPYKDALEQICDFIGAGRAYSGKEFSYELEYEWWQNKISKPCAMHEQTKAFVDKMLLIMMEEHSLDVLKQERSHDIYLETLVDCDYIDAYDIYKSEVQ